MVVERQETETGPEEYTFKELTRTYRRTLNSGKGVTHSKLAYQIGVDPSYLSRLESGARGVPTEHVVSDLAAALGLQGVPYFEYFLKAGYLPEAVQQLSKDEILTVAATLNLLCDPSKSVLEKVKLCSAIKSSINSP